LDDEDDHDGFDDDRDDHGVVVVVVRSVRMRMTMMMMMMMMMLIMIMMMQGLLEMVVGIQEACQAAVSATPREYISFLHTWVRLHDEKRDGLNLDLSHLKAGESIRSIAAK
jgi:hypothetical protein